MRSYVKRMVPISLVLVTLAVIVAVGAASAEEPSTPPGTYDTAVTAPGGLPTAPTAVGDLPQEMKDLIAQGMTMAEAAEVLYPRPPVGTKIPLGNGLYAIVAAGTIPPGTMVETVTVPPHANYTDDATDYVPPRYLHAREVPLYRKLMFEGKGFSIVQGTDGYTHIQE